MGLWGWVMDDKIVVAAQSQRPNSPFPSFIFCFSLDLDFELGVDHGLVNLLLFFNLLVYLVSTELEKVEIFGKT